MIEVRLDGGDTPAWWVTLHQDSGASLLTVAALEQLLIAGVHAAGLSREAPQELRVWNAYDRDEDRLIGTLVAEIHSGLPRSRRSGPYFHQEGGQGHVIAASVWVAPEYRGRGAAESLYAQLAALGLPVFADFANDSLYERFEARYRAEAVELGVAGSGLEL